jgi:hypothetical protein
MVRQHEYWYLVIGASELWAMSECDDLCHGPQTLMNDISWQRPLPILVAHVRNACGTFYTDARPNIYTYSVTSGKSYYVQRQ